MNRIQRFEINTVGRDFAVGDIHGHFTKLQAALDAVQFAPTVDRLFSVGDLVDRGPESEQVLEWLAQPWFHAVQGNHEDMAVGYAEQALRDDLYMHNGGAWLMAKNRDEKAEYAVVLRELPVAIEVETAAGLVGIVHADCPFLSWSTLRDALSGRLSGVRNIEACCQWSRSRIATENHKGVSGVRAVIVGHTPTRQPAVLGNVYHIDTGAWMGGHFTLIDLATLQCHPPINPKLQWDWEPKP
ncbi:metallophosphoesterase [Pseudomonas chlororaphis]|uniref:Ser/Thr phosphatase family protein n=1 Tax=Pseudomonas chlororaphis O6 TaxID=1037915 RepID=A0AB33WTE8_9PSED|nr:metallophosphoesterase [Pseudomonas chlororaphis]EIM16282.1 Ser/Thr phosphatase family protein [Pseudomonas chlororaphis O6]